MSIVTSTDAQQQIAISTLDAFESEPGLTVQETNRGAGTLMIRGFIGPENLIVIDGMRFNQSTYRTGPNQYLNLLPIDLFSSIEVVRGPSGVLFGSGAMGGVVNARTDYHTGAFARFVFDQASDKQHAAGLATETIGDLDLPKRKGLPVLAVRNPGESEFVFNPASDVRLCEGSIVVTLGDARKVQAVDEELG